VQTSHVGAEIQSTKFIHSVPSEEMRTSSVVRGDKSFRHKSRKILPRAGRQSSMLR